jgi:hypothetical protein
MYIIEFEMRGRSPEGPPRVVLRDRETGKVYVRIGEPAVVGEHRVGDKTYPIWTAGPDARAIAALLNQEDSAELNGLADELEGLVRTVAGQLAEVTEIFIGYLGTIGREDAREEIASTVSKLGTMRAQMLAVMSEGEKCIDEDADSA